MSKIKKEASQIEAPQPDEASQIEAPQPDLDVLIAKAGDVHFVYKGRVYVPRFAKVIVPDHGERTALELCADEALHPYLVEVASGVIAEVL